MTLPKFEGRAVAGGRLKLNGFGEDVFESHKQGDDVFFVIQAKVGAIEHVPETKGDQIIRLEKAVIVRTGDMAQADAEKFLNASAERRMRESDERSGVQAIDFPD